MGGSGVYYIITAPLANNLQFCVIRATRSMEFRYSRVFLDAVLLSPLRQLDRMQQRLAFVTRRCPFAASPREGLRVLESRFEFDVGENLLLQTASLDSCSRGQLAALDGANTLKVREVEVHPDLLGASSREPPRQLRSSKGGLHAVSRERSHTKVVVLTRGRGGFRSSSKHAFSPPERGEGLMTK